MWLNFTSMLSWWQWLILAAVPPLIILLYFLKLRRRPLEVPSTYLWHKSIEDLHVNSLWQRLRRNLLLFLQLLVILLAILALLRPSWTGRRLRGDRFIFLIDNSASMQATDLEPSRLEDAKGKAMELIDQMESGDVAMVISFADTARVRQPFTDDRRLLRRAVEAIEPTAQTTSLLEALRAASGLANPGRITEDETGVPLTEELPAKLFIFSDGKFRPVSGFSLGNLEPVFVPIGRSTAANVGIVAFRIGRNESRPEQLQAFARLQNFGTEAVVVGVELFLNDPSAADRADGLIDADEVTLAGPPSGENGRPRSDGQAWAVAFDLGAIRSGVLNLRVSPGSEDHLGVDDQAWAVVSPPRPAQLLLVTPGNEPLELGLKTDFLEQMADVAIEPPEFLGSQRYAEKALSGAYDLVIYDRCAPKQTPRANTLFIGSLPPQGWSRRPKVDSPQLLPVSSPHPLMQWIDLGDVHLLEGRPLEVPPGGSALIDSDVGPMLVIAPREGFEDAVLGFVLVGEETRPEGKTQRYIGTDWMARQSFPVFVLNVFDYLGGGRELLGSENVKPGKPIVLEGPAPQATLRVLHGPTPRSVGGGGPLTGRTAADLKTDSTAKANFTDTARPGPYEVRSGGKTLRRFAVNLFDPAESDIRPDPDTRTIKIGHVEVEGQPGWEVARRDTWRMLLLVGLVVLLLEWYIYNRRVYL